MYGKYIVSSVHFGHDEVTTAFRGSGMNMLYGVKGTNQIVDARRLLSVSRS